MWLKAIRRIINATGDEVSRMFPDLKLGAGLLATPDTTNRRIDLTLDPDGLVDAGLPLVLSVETFAALRALEPEDGDVRAVVEDGGQPWVYLAAHGANLASDQQTREKPDGVNVADAGRWFPLGTHASVGDSGTAIGFAVQNPTLATSDVEQRSPVLPVIGNKWDSASIRVEYGQQMRPDGAGGDEWHLIRRQGGGAWTSVMIIRRDQAGALTLELLGRPFDLLTPVFLDDTDDDYALSFGDWANCDPTANPFTIILPPASEQGGRGVLVTNDSDSLNAITIEPDPETSDLINGLSDYQITEGRVTVSFMSNGTSWVASPKE